MAKTPEFASRAEAVRWYINRIEKLEKALSGMLNDYKSEACSDPECLVCEKSRAAVRKAYAALDEGAIPR